MKILYDNGNLNPRAEDYDYRWAITSEGCLPTPKLSNLNMNKLRREFLAKQLLYFRAISATWYFLPLKY